MKFSKKLTTLATIVAAGFATNAAAETASDTIEVYAGLAPVLELTCSDVKFGVWRVPTRTEGGVTTITLSDDNTTAVATNTTNVALSSAEIAQPAAGSCAFTGSAVATGETAMGVSMAATEATTGAGTLTAGTLIAAANNVYADINGASAGAALEFTLNFPTTTAVDSNGAGSFKIAGVLTIPETIVADNYGGYKQNGTITVTIDDGV